MKTILIDAINTLVLKDVGIDTKIFELLEEYPQRKIVLTNADDVQMAASGLLDLPYEVFTLKHSPDKTNTLYFKKFLADFNLGGNDVLYIEHNEGAVKSAESLGIKTLHFDKNVRDLNTVRNFLDENLGK